MHGFINVSGTGGNFGCNTIVVGVHPTSNKIIGNNNLQIATWNISIKGKKVIDPSGTTYYSHKFKNLFDETDEEYKKLRLNAYKPVK